MLAVPFLASGQNGGVGLTITNYRLAGEVRYSRTEWFVTYKADLTNTGAARSGVTAKATSLVPSVQVVTGQEVLHFANVPANSVVTSIDTFTLLVDRSVPFDTANIAWTFLNPVANPGSNQTAQVGATVMLNGSASSNPSGVGTLAYQWALEARPPASQAKLSNAATPIPSFVVDAPGNYRVSLTVDNGTATDRAFVTASTGNSPPVAQAGSNQTAALNSVVTLNGAGSYDVDGDPLTYSWSLISRPVNSTAELAGGRSVKPTLIVDQPGIYIARLIVNDGVSDSMPSTVTVTTINTPPVANAGPNQTVIPGVLVQLNGAASTDVDGDPITYRWSIITVPAGSAAVLSSVSAVNPTFTADKSGTYVAQLIVNDGKVDSPASTVTVTTNAVQPPVANAGPNQTVAHNTIVALDGSCTDPQRLSCTLKWSLITRPAGSVAALSATNIPNPTLLADVPGIYVAQLVVNNGVSNSQPSTITITTTNTPPVADAGQNRSVFIGAVVALDGANSSDADRDPLTFLWSFASKPVSSTTVLQAATGKTPSFFADVAGTYVVQLIVNDGFTSSNPVTVTITASSMGITVSPNPLNLSNAPVTLTITLSAPAGQGGALVSFTGFDANIISAPASILVPENSTGANITVTPVAPGNTNLIVSAAGFQPASVPVKVATPSIAISSTLTAVGVARSISGSITLSAAAPQGGVVVTLSGTAGIVGFDSPSVSIAAGQTTGAFKILGIAEGSATITATSPAYVGGSLTILVVKLGSIALPANLTLAPGQSAALDVKLALPAPADGVTITLASADTSILTVSPSAFIAQGATTPVIPPQVTGVAYGSTTITASAPGLTGDVQTVKVAASLSFPSQAVKVGAGGVQSTNVLLSAPAPTGGLLITLTSSNTSVATVPGTVSIVAGATTATVPVTAAAVGTATITASTTTPEVTGATLNVSVLVYGSISLPSNLSVVAGQSVAFPIALTAPAPPGGTAVALTTSNAATGSIAPASVTIPAGLTEPVSQPKVTGVSVGAVSIGATAPGFRSTTAEVTVVDAVDIMMPVTLTVSPGDVVAHPIKLANTYSFPVALDLTSSDTTKVTVSPSLVTIPAGQVTPSTTVLVAGIAAGTATITASGHGVNLAPASTAVSVIKLTLSPSPLTILGNGTNATLYLLLSSPAPAGGIDFTIRSSNPGVVTVPSGVFLSATSSSTGVRLTSVSAGTAVIHVSAPGIPEATATVTVVPPGGIGFSGPSSISINQSANLNVSLSSAASAGGITVEFTTSDAGKVSISPSSVVIPAGAVAPVAAPQISGVNVGSATISASATGYTAPPPLLVNVGTTVAWITQNATILGNGNQTLLTLRLAVPTPVTGLTVNLTSSNPSVATVLATAAFTWNANLSPTITVPVTSVAPGTTIIHATGVNIPDVATTVTVIASLSITSTSLPNGVPGAPYSATVTATGGISPYVWSASGLPSALTIDPDTGAISGTPAAAGSSTVTITVTDARQPTASTASKQLTLKIAPGVSITTASLPSGGVGMSYAAGLTATGGVAPYSWSATGLPSGISIDPATGTISGTATAASSGTVTVTVTDATSPTHLSASKPFILTIAAALDITTNSLPSGPAGTPYSTIVAAVGGVPAYSWSATGLPNGLSMNATTGEISGTPTATGPNSVTVTVTDSASPTHHTVSKSLALTINSGLSITTKTLANPKLGAPYSATVSATGGVAPLSWSATGLPAGLSIASATGIISGTPSSLGSGTAMISVIDSTTPSHQTATKQFTWTVAYGLTLSPSSLTIRGTGNQAILSLLLSAPAPPGGIEFALSSSNTAVATVASFVPLTESSSSVSVRVFSAGTGSAVIHVSAPGISDATATVTVLPPGSVTLAGPASVVLSQSGDLKISLTTPAPTGGVTVDLTSSDPAIVQLPAASITIPEGATTPVTQPQVIGINVGAASVTASAPGYLASAPLQINVRATVAWITQNPTITGIGNSILVTLRLSNAAPFDQSTGVSVNLTSSNPGVATIQATGIFIWDGSTAPGIVIPVTAVGPGTTTLHASGVNIPDVTTTVTVITGLTITTASLSSGVVGVPYSATLAPAGGTPPYSWSATGLPANLTFNASTAAISGTPAAAGSNAVSITLTDSSTPTHQTVTRHFTLNIVAGLSITTPALPGGLVNSAYSATVTATGGTTPYSWSAGGLPANLTMDPTTGVISGTPASAGSSSVTITVSDSTSPSHLSTSRTLTLAVGIPLSIATASLPGGLAGGSYSFTLTGAGGAKPYSWSATGLPANLTIDAFSGLISGTPAAAGSSTVHVVLTDSTSPTQQSAANDFTLTIGAGLSIGTAALPGGVAGSAYSFSIAALGGVAPYSWAATGLPASLTMNASTGAISGIPSAAGASTVHVTLTDSATPGHVSVSKDFPLTIGPALSITTASLPGGVATSAYSATLAAAGGTPSYTWSATGLPATLSINASTGVISGTPALAGSISLDATVCDSYTPQQCVTKHFTIPISAALSITTAALSDGVVDGAYSFAVTAAGGTPSYTWSAIGLPANLTMNSSTGVISGMPAAAGSNSVNVTVTDSTSPTHQSVSKPLTLNIAAGLSITTASLPGGIAGTPYTFTVSGGSGTTPYSWSASGLPANLTINASTGAISGTPSTAGSSTVHVTLTDSASPARISISKDFPLTIAPAVSITTPSLPGGQAGSPYSVTVIAAGGAPVYSWSATGLPASLSIGASTGVISGTPAVAGSNSVDVTACDSYTPQQCVTKHYTLAIAALLSVTTASLSDGIAGGSYSFTAAAAGGTPPYTWSTPDLPPALTIAPSTGVISGIPATAGFYGVTLTVTDSSSPSRQSVAKRFNLTIGQGLSISTGALPDGVANTTYSAAVVAAGGLPPYSWKATGLPGGLTINAASGAISGTPTAAASATVTVTVTDSENPNVSVSRQMSLRVVGPVSIATASPLPGGVAGSAYSATVAAAGGVLPYSWSAAGLPSTLTLNPSTGVISGTPAAAASMTVTVTVTDSTSPTHQSVSKPLTLTIGPALSITTTSLTAGVAALPYSATVAAAGGTTPYSWSATGLPASFTINPATGVISGTPSAAGSSTVTVTATDATSPTHQSISKVFTLAISPPLSIATTSLSDGFTTFAYSATVVASGGNPSYSWSASGLPAGLTINPTSGGISGTPAATGKSTVTLTVTDSTAPAHQSVSKTLTLSILPGLTISTTSLPDGYTNIVYSATVAAAGGTPNYSWSASGLPAGLAIATSTGVISGTPTATGTVTATITATDSTSPAHLTIAKSLSIIIKSGPSITTTGLPTLPAGTAYSVTLTASGGTAPYTWSASGLPTGFNISSAGVISGSPTSPSTTTVDVSVTDSTAPTHLTMSKQFTLVIGPGLSVVTATLPTGVASSPYSVTLSATGGTPPYTWAATGLPTGLTISSGGVISGAPAAASSGNVSITVTDSTPTTHQSKTVQLPLNVTPAVSITTASLPSNPAGSPYSATLAATGGTAPYTWTATGLPTGLTMSAGGVISGSPTAASSGQVNVTVTDSTAPAHQTAQKSLTLTITAPLSIITTSPLPTGQVGTAYTKTIVASGGTPPYTWTQTGLPTGFNINATTGEISGNASTPSTSTVNVTVADATSPTHQSVTKQFVLAIGNVLTITTNSLPNGQVNLAYGPVTVTASGGTPPYVSSGGYVWSSPDLPRSLSINPSTGVISGTPLNPGTTTVHLTLTDSTNSAQVANKTLSLTIVAPPLSLTTTSLPTGTVNVAYSAQPLASGGIPPYNWTSSVLPAGLQINNITGLIDGIPTALGVYPVTLTVTDSTPFTTQTVSRTMNLTVAAVQGGGKITVSSANVGQNLQTPITITLLPPPAANVTLTISSNNSAVLLGSRDTAGAATVTALITANTSTVSTYVKGTAASGTATITASILGYTNGVGTVTLYRSGFVLESPDGIGTNFITYQGGVSSSLVVHAARLNSSAVFAEEQELRGLFSIAVPLTNDPSYGTLSPQSVTLSGASSSAKATFTTKSLKGVTTISAGAPSPFSLPATGASVTATIQANGLLPCDAANPTVAVGKNLQTSACVQLTSASSTSAEGITIQTNNSAKLKFSTTPTGALSDTLTLTVPINQKFTPNFFVHAFDSVGPASYTVSSTHYGSVTVPVTLAASGFVILTPAGFSSNFNLPLGSPDPTLSVYTARFDTAGAVTPQPPASGVSVSVIVASGTPSVGTIVTSPITISAGADSASTDFHIRTTGSTTITASSSGWTTGSVLATVQAPTPTLPGGVTIGQFLQEPGNIVLANGAPAGGLHLTLQSNSPLLNLSANATVAGSALLGIDVAPGQFIVPFYMQSLGSSGTVTYTVSAPGYTAATGRVDLAPSGIVILCAQASVCTFAATGGPQPLTVFTAQLTPGTNVPSTPQALAGGQPLSVALGNSNRNAGSLASGSVLIQPNTSSSDVQFTPAVAGMSTTVSVQQPANWTTPASLTQLLISIQ